MNVPSMCSHRRFAALFPVLATAGCVGLAREAPQKIRYVLQVSRPAGTPARAPLAAGTILRVRPFHLATPTSTQSLVFRRAASRFEADFYHEWLGPPEQNVAVLAKRWLEDSGLFAAVVDADSSLEATHVLEGDLTALFGDLSGDRPHAVLGCAFVLLEGPDDALVFARRYEEREPLPADTPDELVAGFERALARILRALEEDLERALHRSAALLPGDLELLVAHGLGGVEVCDPRRRDDGGQAAGEQRQRRDQQQGHERGNEGRIQTGHAFEAGDQHAPER